MEILHLFGASSGLKTNLQKSNTLPIRCEEHDLQIVQQHLPCALADFPCKYLGLPLALIFFKKEHIQPIIDRMADLLPGWKADLLTRAGRKVHVQFVLTATIIYLAMALDLPLWAHKAIDKIQRNYFWRGQRSKRRSLPCFLGHGVPTHCFGGAWYLQSPGSRLGIEGKMAMVEEN
jgi:hypothetical protein